MTPFETDHWVIALDPVALDLGIIQIRWYALAYIAGLVLGWQYVNSMLRTQSLWTHPSHKGTPPAQPADIDDLLVWATIGVILGGRLGFVFLYAMWYEDYRAVYIAEPWRIFALWEGGMAFHGGLLGVVLAIVIFSRRRGLDMFRIGDLAAVATPIGLFFGRIANFINGELWGKVTTAPWGMIFMSEVVQDRRNGIEKPAEAYVRHPSQLYEAVLEGLVLFVVLVVLVRKFKILDRPGLATGIFLIGYALARGSVEFFRESTAYVFHEGHWFTVGMLLSLPMIAIGLAFIWRAKRYGPVLNAEPAEKTKPAARNARTQRS